MTNPLDVPGPWDEDVTAILEGYWAKGVDLRTDLSPDLLRTAMCEAWRFGYSSGMADSAKIDQQLITAEHVITIDGPIAYPGGKDGMFRARCRCGKYESDFGTENEVRRAGAAHVRDKRSQPRTHPTGFIAAPVERAQCVPECDWLETRKHAEGCQQ